jgi:hypothetical protein
VGLRFQRTFSLLGGLARLSVSKSSLGLSLGPRGLSFNIGLIGKRRQRPNTLSIGLPGSGLSYRTAIGTAHHDPMPRQKLLPSMPLRRSRSDCALRRHLHDQRTALAPIVHRFTVLDAVRRLPDFADHHQTAVAVERTLPLGLAVIGPVLDGVLLCACDHQPIAKVLSFVFDFHANHRVIVPIIAERDARCITTQFQSLCRSSTNEQHGYGGK